jgi:hypothetical protein
VVEPAHLELSEVHCRVDPTIPFGYDGMYMDPVEAMFVRVTEADAAIQSPTFTSVKQREDIRPSVPTITDHLDSAAHQVCVSSFLGRRNCFHAAAYSQAMRTVGSAVAAWEHFISRGQFQGTNAGCAATTVSPPGQASNCTSTGFTCLWYRQAWTMAQEAC